MVGRGKAHGDIGTWDVDVGVVREGKHDDVGGVVGGSRGDVDEDSGEGLTWKKEGTDVGKSSWHDLDRRGGWWCLLDTMGAELGGQRSGMLVGVRHPLQQLTVVVIVEAPLWMMSQLVAFGVLRLN